MKLSTICLLLSSALAMAEDLTTLSGVEHKGVTVSRVEADALVLMTDAGIVRVKFSDLPEDVRRRYGYDPKRADAAAKALEATANAQRQNAAKENRFQNWKREIQSLKRQGTYEQDSPLDLRIQLLEAKLERLRKEITALEQKGVKAEILQHLIDCTFKEQVFVGMPEVFALISWGKPREVNRTTTADGTREQWVYPRGEIRSDYLYVENGIVTAVQN